LKQYETRKRDAFVHKFIKSRMIKKCKSPESF